MSKLRAQRRAERLAAAEKERAVRERRRRRRAALRRLRPRLPDRRRTGKLYARRSRAERAGIAIAAVLALGLVWLLIDPLALRIGLTALVLLVAPALVVITLDRRI